MFQQLLKKWYQSKLNDKQFLFLFDEEPIDEYVCLDCETTGLNPRKDEILSIGAVIIKGNKILMSKTLNIFVKPSKNVTEESIKIHQIRPIDLENAITPQEAIFELLEFIGNRAIVGYYIKFDVAMINKYTDNFWALNCLIEPLKSLQCIIKLDKKTQSINLLI